MEFTLLFVLIAALAGFWLARRGRGLFDPAKRSDDQLLMEYTVHLHKIGRATRMGRMPLVSVVGQCPAADELARRGFDPDKAIDEKFNARREGRSMDWDSCRLDGET